jgi:hypothetical protein
VKYVDADLLPRMKKPWWYGYGSKLRAAAEGFLDFQFASGLGARVKGALRSSAMITRKRR